MLTQTYSIKTATEIPIVVFAHETAPAAGLMGPISNIHGFPKPMGGLWTTPMGGQGWTAWCQDEQWGDWEDHKQHHLAVARPVRVAVIENTSDLGAIIEQHGYEVDMFGSQLSGFIDYAAMSVAGWDGIWLTDAGQWATRLSKPANLYGWDTETILWFDWVF